MIRIRDVRTYITVTLEGGDRLGKVSFKRGKRKPTQKHLCSFFSVILGRLLRANQITFNWDRLASWINLTEQWPYRTSWLILHLEETEGVPDQLTLKTIYERLVDSM